MNARWTADIKAAVPPNTCQANLPFRLTRIASLWKGRGGGDYRTIVTPSYYPRQPVTFDNGVPPTPVASRYAGAAAPASPHPFSPRFIRPGGVLSQTTSWVWLETVSELVSTFELTYSASSLTLSPYTAPWAHPLPPSGFGGGG